MPLIALKCPSCTGQIDFEASRDVMFCKYCGTKILREHIIQTTPIHDAQYYYENWLKLRKKWVNSGYKDYVTQKALNEIDVEFTKLYCDDYRRLFADAIVLTNDFSPKHIWESDHGDAYYGEIVDEIRTYVNIGGLGKENELKQIRNQIAIQSNNSQSKAMLAQIDNQIRQLEEVNSQLLSGYTSKNIIKVQKKKKKLFGLF